MADEYAAFAAMLLLASRARSMRRDVTVHRALGFHAACSVGKIMQKFATEIADFVSKRRFLPVDAYCLELQRIYLVFRYRLSLGILLQGQIVAKHES